MWRSFVLQSGGLGQDYVSATTCCIVLQRLLASRPCFGSVKSMPEVASVLFEVLFFTLSRSQISFLFRYQFSANVILHCNELFQVIVEVTVSDSLSLQRF
jgi:hypothetical protein